MGFLNPKIMRIVLMEGMLDYSSPDKLGPYPINKIQCETMFDLAAKLAKKYGILITPQTVLTHYEFGQAHLKSTSYGKIDITYLPPYPTVKKDEVGDFIRSKIKWQASRVMKAT